MTDGIWPTVLAEVRQWGLGLLLVSAVLEIVLVVALLRWWRRGREEWRAARRRQGRRPLGVGLKEWHDPDARPETREEFSGPDGEK